MDFGALPNGRANAPEISNTLLPLAGNLSPGLSPAFMFSSLAVAGREIGGRSNAHGSFRSGLAPKTGLRL